MAIIVKGSGGKPEEEKTVTAGTSAIVVSPSSGKVMKKVTVNPTPSETKTVTPKASKRTVSPSSGKLLSKVTVNGDSDLVAENIKKGINIFGVGGTFDNSEGLYVWKKLSVQGGDFIDYVVSDKETAFPDGGEKDGYWYERVAEANVATGSITLSSSSNILNIEHGLGKAPTKFAVILSSGTEIHSSGTISALYDGTNCYLNWYGEILSSYMVMGGTGTPTISDTNISIPHYRSNWVAATYQWIAVAE